MEGLVIAVSRVACFMSFIEGQCATSLTGLSMGLFFPLRNFSSDGRIASVVDVVV